MEMLKKKRVYVMYTYVYHLMCHPSEEQTTRNIRVILINGNTTPYISANLIKGYTTRYISVM